MELFKDLTSDDKAQDVAIVTSGVFQDGASSIQAFHTSSTQIASSGDYSADVYRYDPAGNASASVQFGVAYGHADGSGSLGGTGITGERTSAAVFGQFNNMINPPQTTRFTFGNNSTAKHFYAITFNRARIRENLEPGGWELHLGPQGANPDATQGGVAVIGTPDQMVKLIDDSSNNPGGTTNARNFSPEYNIVSGTLVGGTYVHKQASDEDETMGSYGTFYPSIGTLILNADRLAGRQPQLVTFSGSNANNENTLQMVNFITTGSYFQAKRQEQITSTHYFVRATAKKFNSTSNETYYTESLAGVKRIVAGMRTDPKTYITTVGLYNKDNEMLAVAKLSQPILKSTSREALIKVKLDF